MFLHVCMPVHIRSIQTCSPCCCYQNICMLDVENIYKLYTLTNINIYIYNIQMCLHVETCLHACCQLVCVCMQIIYIFPF